MLTYNKFYCFSAQSEFYCYDAICLCNKRSESFHNNYRQFDVIFALQDKNFKR